MRSRSSDEIIDLGLRSREDLLNGVTYIPCLVDLIDDLFFIHPGDLGECIEEEVGADTKFLRAPVRKYAAHNEPHEDREFIV